MDSWHFLAATTETSLAAIQLAVRASDLRASRLLQCAMHQAAERLPDLHGVTLHMLDAETTILLHNNFTVAERFDRIKAHEELFLPFERVSDFWHLVVAETSLSVRSLSSDHVFV